MDVDYDRIRQHDERIKKSMKKMCIVIYSHDMAEAQFYETLCRKLSRERHIPIELKSYRSGSELLFDFEEEPNFRKRVDVLYIVLNEADLELSDQIRKLGYANLIVFIGLKEIEMSYEYLFDTRIYNFVQVGDAPANLDRFAQIFQEAGEVIAKRYAERLILSYGGEIRQIDIRQIHYFEVQQHTLVVHYGEGEAFTFISSLSKIENQLKGRGFMRVSRFYVVSVYAVQSLTADSALMLDGASIPLGRKYHALLKEAIDKKVDKI